VDEVFSSLEDHASYRSPHPSLPLPELTQCLERTASQWSTYPVVPSYFFSKWLYELMVEKIRDITTTCAATAKTLDILPPGPHVTTTVITAAETQTSEEL
jgi:hypothetical protein